MEMLRRLCNGLEFLLGIDNFPNGHAMTRQVCFPSGHRIPERNPRKLAFEQFFHNVARDQITLRGLGCACLFYYELRISRRDAPRDICCPHHPRCCAQCAYSQARISVVSISVQPHSAVEPPPQTMVSPARLSPATWSLGHSRSVF